MGQLERLKKRKRKKHTLLRFVIFILLCIGAYYFLNTDLFDISKVQVEGNNYYNVEQIKDKANIKIGQNIFELRKAKLKQKLLKDPYLKDVRIKRKLPATILIQVKERKEMATVPRDETFVIIDEDGLVLRISKDEPKITKIMAMKVKKAVAGKPLDVEGNSLLNDTLRMLKQAKKADIFFKKIDTSNVIIRAHIYDQLICEGTPENLTESLEKGNLQAALYEMYSKGIERGIIKIGSDNYCSFDPNVE